MRILLLAHRYLGIATGLLMVMWCLSGIVMMYVPYPHLSEDRRLRGLVPISWRGCCVVGRAARDGEGLDNFGIEMLAGRPVLRRETGRPLDLLTGGVIEGVGTAQAAEVAVALASRLRGAADVSERRAHLLRVVHDDTWTMSGVSDAERPLYQFAIGDEAGTELYVSSVSGRAVQVTTARQRFWNWLGAIPHWLYFAGLRRHQQLWAAVVVYTSLAGCFLTMTGIVIGLQQLRRSPGRWSPHRRLHLWHHVAGLVFGIFTLTWVASGFVSMNPWGLFESGGMQVDRLRLRGPTPTAERVKVAVGALASALIASEAISIAGVPLAGKIYFIVETGAGDRFRLDETGHLATLTNAEIVRAATELWEGVPVASLELMTKEDAYFFGRPGAAATLPVYRVVLGGDANTRYYLDPVSAEIEAKIDGNARAYRWLYQGLHRLDALPVLRIRPAWDVLMISLLSGVLVVCGTGAYLGVRRLVQWPGRRANRAQHEGEPRM